MHISYFYIIISYSIGYIITKEARFISRMSGQTTRIRYIDIMKGITILLVMVGHYFNNRLVSTFIWSFHMPLFLFISGYFFRDLPFRQRLHKASVSILLPIGSPFLPCLFWRAFIF